MVYRGRPSTGCRKCRERKIKCDERPHGCMKCAERGYTCPGYDRNIDAFFRDETAHVEARAKRSEAKAEAARLLVRDARASRAAYSGVLDRSGPGLQLSQSLIDQGISFFMSYYCMGIEQPPANSEEYRQHLSSNGFHPLVATSMTALGIAGVANLYMDSHLKREATRWYLNAIKMANAAISSPKDVKADSTLSSVNLLSMFEATHNDHTLDGWINHVDGAASLIKLRGKEQFSTAAGQRMYLHTVSLLAMNCMGRGVPLPQYVHDMNTEAMKHMNTTDPRNKFFFLHIKGIGLRARILNQEIKSLAEIIEAALELDNIANGAFDDQGPEWEYDVVPCEEQAGMFNHFYHVYPTAIAAQTWNWMRYNRIYFHDIIRNSILAGFAASPPVLVDRKYHEQLETSTRILYKLQSDIIATMPQFLQDVPSIAPWNDQASSTTASPLQPKTPPSPKRTSRLPSKPQGPLKSIDQNFRRGSDLLVRHSHGTAQVKDRLPIVRVAGGYSTVWALYVAGAMPMASSESQDIVYAILTRIEREFGINQARVLANALQLKRRMSKVNPISFTICPEYLLDVEGPYLADDGMESKSMETMLGESSPDFLYDI